MLKIADDFDAPRTGPERRAPVDPTPAPALRRAVPRVWAAVVLAALTLLLTAGGVYATLHQRRLEDDRRFVLLANELHEELSERVDRYRRVLVGAGGFFRPAAAADPNAFRRAVEDVRLHEDLPAATGMGFIARVPADDEAAFLRSMHAAGRTDFRLHGEGPAVPGAPRYVITRIEPAQQNAAAIGLDIAREPRRRAAAQAAWASGEPTLTAPIELVQQRGGVRDFLMLHPVRGGDRGGHPGWIYLALRGEVLCAGLGQRSGHELAYRVDAGDGFTEPAAEASAAAGLRHTIPLAVAGRRWDLEVFATPAFRRSSSIGAVMTLIGGGTTAWLVLALGVLRSRAGRFATAAADAGGFDPLTRLRNRSAIEARITSALARTRCDPGHRFAVLFLDFDRFKQVNDSLGHAAGDELLQMIGRRIQTTLRPGDAATPGRRRRRPTAARLGGDEFLVLLDGLRKSGDAQRVAERLQNVLKRPYRLRGGGVESRASIGVVEGHARHADADAVIADADAAMSAAKERGRGCVVAFDAAMHAAARQRRQLQKQVPDVLAGDGLPVTFRPIHERAGGRVVRAAATLAWPARPDDPVDPVNPEEALALIRSGEHSAAVAAWTLDRVFSRGAAAFGVAVSAPLSCDQILAPGFVAELTARLAERPAGWPEAWIEVVDTPESRAREHFTEVLNDLHVAGVPVALSGVGNVVGLLDTLYAVPVAAVTLRTDIGATGRRGNPLPAGLIAEILAFADDEGVQTVARRNHRFAVDSGAAGDGFTADEGAAVHAEQWHAAAAHPARRCAA